MFMTSEKGGGAPEFEAPILTPESGDDDLEKAFEQPPSRQESGAGKQAPAILKSTPKTVSKTITDRQSDQKPATKTDDDQHMASVNDLLAEDNDLIEKEWVERAKSIIAKTQDDPYIQKKEMSKVKADYIQKRYKKTVKTDDAVAT